MQSTLKKSYEKTKSFFQKFILSLHDDDALHIGK